jgi:hypothetical protein
MANKDRYLDCGKIIQELAAAERSHQLDADGVIEKLRTAENHCREMQVSAETRAEEFGRLADAYILARGYYFAEIKNRVEAQGGFFKRWFTRNGGTSGVGTSSCNAYALIRIAEAADPLEALRKKRLADATRRRVYTRRARIEKLASDLEQAADPLYLAKRAWGNLSPAQQDEFFRWAKIQLHRHGRDTK